MEQRRKEVTFEAKASRYSNCCCDACYGLSNVTKFTLPRTKYFNGKDLTTKYSHFWICDDCKAKLIAALQNPEPEEKEEP